MYYACALSFALLISSVLAMFGLTKHKPVLLLPLIIFSVSLNRVFDLKSLNFVDYDKFLQRSRVDQQDNRPLGVF